MLPSRALVDFYVRREVAADGKKIFRIIDRRSGASLEARVTESAAVHLAERLQHELDRYRLAMLEKAAATDPAELPG